LDVANKNDKYFTYLTIVNAKDSVVSLCISSTIPLPVPDTWIKVQAHYGNTEVGLQAVFSEPFPSFLQMTQ